MTTILALLALQTSTTRISKLSPIRPPSYANRATRQLMERTLRLYDSPKSYRFDVNSSEGSRSIWFQSGKLRERSARLEWSYDGKNVCLVDMVGKRFYSGALKKSKFATALESLHYRMDPSLWQLVYRRNPIRAVLDADLRVSKAGSIRENGVLCHILRATGPGARIAILASVQNGFVYRITSDVVNSKGRTLSTSDRAFSHVKLGLPMQPETFQLKKPAGYSAGSLSSLLK